jgi:hypothetical protein
MSETFEQKAARAAVQATLEQKYLLEVSKKYIEFEILGLSPHSPQVVEELAKMHSYYLRTQERLTRELPTNPLDKKPL